MILVPQDDLTDHIGMTGHRADDVQTGANRPIETGHAPVDHSHRDWYLENSSRRCHTAVAITERIGTRYERWEWALMGKTRAGKVGERGAALIETAIILPLLLLLVFGIWATARAWNVSNTMEHAAREAVRYASTELPWDGASEGNVRAVVDSELAGSSIPPASVQTACIGQGASPCSFGTTAQGYDQVAVELIWPSYTMEFLLFSFDIDLAVEAVGRYEG